jgi:hypothetical protein
MTYTMLLPRDLGAALFERKQLLISESNGC